MSTIDAEVNPCRQCGGAARAWRAEPNDSTFNGAAGVTCSKCGYEVTVEPHSMKVQGRAGDTGWDHVFRKLDAAVSESVYRWNAINPKPKVYTAAEQLESRRAWAAAFIEENRLLRHETPDYLGRDGRVSVVIPETTYSARGKIRTYTAYSMIELYDQFWEGEHSFTERHW